MYILPDDVLGLIREFSRPRMRYVNEFVEAQCLFKKYKVSYSPQLHGIVKTKLSTPDAYNVWIVFVQYIKASFVMRRALLDLTMTKEKDVRKLGEFSRAYLRHVSLCDILRQ